MNIINTNSSSNPNLNFEEVKEIQCKDCGLIYFIKPAAISSTCSSCGNIAFHPKHNAKLISKKSTNSQINGIDVQVSPLQAAIDPGTIEVLAIQYQQEWQIWAKVTENFADMNIHLAYLSFVTRNLIFSRAAERYKEHRNHYLQMRDEFWQVEIAEEMLEKIACLCTIQFDRHKTILSNRNPVLAKSKVYLLWFLILGIIIFTKIFSYFVPLK